MRRHLLLGRLSTLANGCSNSCYLTLLSDAQTYNEFTSFVRLPFRARLAKPALRVLELPALAVLLAQLFVEELEHLLASCRVEEGLCLSRRTAYRPTAPLTHPTPTKWQS